MITSEVQVLEEPNDEKVDVVFCHLDVQLVFGG